MSYYIDLSMFTLSAYQERLKTARLIPSQKILLEEIDQRFKEIESQSIGNVQELQMALKTKPKLNQFAHQSGVPADYLTVLRREANSYHPKPRLINDFVCISTHAKEQLLSLGIKDTKKLYSKIETKSEQKSLMEKVSLSFEELQMLIICTNFSRIRYVSPDFTHLLINSKYNTIEKIAKVKPEDLYEEMKELNAENKYFKGILGQSDMAFLINDADFYLKHLKLL